MYVLVRYNTQKENERNLVLGDEEGLNAGDGHELERVER